VDVATHALIPYAAALVALRRKGDARWAWAAVFGVAAAAPDLDGLLGGLARRVDALWFLQHRGLSHSLFGAPLFAFALVGALALAARAWPRRLGLFAWQPAFVPLLVLGSWTHLVLDGVTLSGVPLLFPFSSRRFGFEVFPWQVDLLFPIPAAILLLHALGRLPPRRVAQAGALVAILLLALGAGLLAERPADAAHAYPHGLFREWIVVDRAANGTLVAEVDRDGARVDPTWFPESIPPEAAPAINAAESTNAYRGFLLGSYGPMALDAEPAPGGGWIVSFTDAAQRYESLHEPWWVPAEDRGLETFLVRDGVATETRQGW